MECRSRYLHRLHKVVILKRLPLSICKKWRTGKVGKRKRKLPQHLSDTEVEFHQTIHCEDTRHNGWDDDMEFWGNSAAQVPRKKILVKFYIAGTFSNLTARPIPWTHERVNICVDYIINVKYMYLSNIWRESWTKGSVFYTLHKAAKEKGIVIN